MRLDGLNIVVAGGGSGIGRAVAMRCVEYGAQVTILGRRRERLEAVGEATGASIFSADLRKSPDVRAALAFAKERMGGVDGLVNAVGVLDTHGIDAIDDRLWSDVIASNLGAIFLLCREAMPFLRLSKGASIVNIAALAAITPGVASVAYSAAKAGVVQLSHVLAAQSAPSIRVNSVCPGAVDTDMTQGFLGGKSEAERTAFTARYACRRMAEPDEIAGLITFLLSREASYITGSNFVADGGRAYR